MAKKTGVKFATTSVVVKTVFGHTLSAHEERAYNTVKRLIEKEESFTKRHGMADAFRSYFKKDYIKD